MGSCERVLHFMGRKVKGRQRFGIYRVVADVWKKDVWDLQAKSGSSGSCRLFFHFLEKIAVQKLSGKCLEVPDILLPDIRSLLNVSCEMGRHEVTGR